VQPQSSNTKTAYSPSQQVAEVSCASGDGKVNGYCERNSVIIFWALGASCFGKGLSMSRSYQPKWYFILYV